MSFKSAKKYIEENIKNKEFLHKDGLYIILYGDNYDFKIRADLKYSDAIMDFYAAFLCNGKAFSEAYARQTDLYLGAIGIFDYDEYETEYRDPEDPGRVEGLLTAAINGATNWDMQWSDDKVELLKKISNNYQLAEFICKEMKGIDQIIKVENGNITLVYGWEYNN